METTSVSVTARTWFRFVNSLSELVNEIRETKTVVETKTWTKTKMSPPEVLGRTSKKISYKTFTRDRSLGEGSRLVIHILCLPFRALSTGLRVPLTHYYSPGSSLSGTRRLNIILALLLRHSQTQLCILALCRAVLGLRNISHFVNDLPPNFVPTKRHYRISGLNS